MPDLPDLPDAHIVEIDVLVGLADADVVVLQNSDPTGGRDVDVGASASFAPLDEADEPPLGTTVILTEEGRSAVEWTYRCLHVGPFNGISKTEQTLTIRGVTVVDREMNSVRRYVDWSSVMADLGVTFSFRPALEQLPPDWGSGD